MSKSLKDKIISYYTHYYKDLLGLPNFRELSERQILEEQEESKRIKNLEKILGKFAGKKILDVGCGTGGFVIAAAQKGATAFGLDPDKKALAICFVKKKEYNLTNAFFKEGAAERLPFEDKEFDIIYSLAVLEHVQNIEKAIMEMVRVTKKGGIIYIKTPNYLSFYEGHYKIFWLPLFPKPLTKLYLKARSRPTAFINSINYVTSGTFKNILEKYNLNYRFLHNPIERQKGLINTLIYLYQKLFKIEQNIEILIKT